MNGISICLGLFGGCLAGALFTAYHGSPCNGGNDRDFSLIIAALVGLYIWFPFHYWGKEEQLETLHSDPTLYPVPLKTAFSDVQKILETSNHGLCDKWRIIRADTNVREIQAQMVFSDTEEQFVPGAVMNVGSKYVPMRRMLELTVQFKDCGDWTEILVDFIARVEGPQFMACDSIMHNFYEQLAAKCGPGKVVGSRDRLRQIAAPPLWLLLLTLGVTIFYPLRVLEGFTGGH